MPDRPGLVARFWFPIALFALLPLGVAFPEGGTRLRETPGALDALVALTLFLSSFGLDPGHLRRQLGEGRPLALSLGATYIVAPILGVALALGLAPDDVTTARAFFEAVMIAAAQGSTLVSAQALVAVAGGDAGLALVLTIASNLATVVLTPLLLQSTLGVAVSLPASEMIGQMAVVVLGPVLLAQLLRPFLWQAAEPLRFLLRLIPQGIILVFVYTAVAAAGARLVAAPDLAFRFFVVAVGLHVGLLAFTYAGSTALGLMAKARTAVVLCGSQKTLPNGIYLWDQFFSANPHGAVALVTLHVLQLVLDALLVPWLAPPRSPSRDGDASIMVD